MIKTELEQLARTIAAKHDLPPEIVCGMIEREATENQWAVRYEPGFLARYVMAQYNAGKLDVTETYTRAMSFGVMQVMGQTARELGFDGLYLTELCNPPVGIEFGCRKLADCLKRCGGNVDAALLAYNGGSNKDYPGEVEMLAIDYRTPGPIAV
jgi:soluble lytic murein transglycosylase-like protein